MLKGTLCFCVSWPGGWMRAVCSHIQKHISLLPWHMQKQTHPCLFPFLYMLLFPPLHSCISTYFSALFSATLCTDTLSLLFTFTHKVLLSSIASCLILKMLGRKAHIHSRQWKQHGTLKRNSKASILFSNVKAASLSRPWTFQHQGQLHCKGKKMHFFVLPRQRKNDTGSCQSKSPVGRERKP